MPLQQLLEFPEELYTTRWQVLSLSHGLKPVPFSTDFSRTWIRTNSLPGRKTRAHEGVREMDEKDPLRGWRFLVWFIAGLLIGVVILKAILG